MLLLPQNRAELVRNGLKAAKASRVPFVLVAEGWNVKTGLGSRFGSALLQAGFKGRYNHIGTNREGSGGLWQQMGHQGLDSAGIERALRALL